MEYPKEKDIDVLLILEGTYPFISGGVSTWVHQIISYLKEFRFGILFLGSSPEEYDGFKYALPNNVCYLEAQYLFPSFEKPPAEFNKIDEKAILQTITDLHAPFLQTEKIDGQCALSAIEESIFSEKSGISEQVFWYEKPSWDYTLKKYTEKCAHMSFIDYFWMVRNLHAPLWRLFNISKKVPVPKLYHSASTGYAGMLAALLAKKNKKPFILSEHGIYTKERRIDLLQKNWLEAAELKEGHEEYINDRWISLFEIMARICYAQADPIISLFQLYQNRQIEDGADPKKTIIIPNGVDCAMFDKLKKNTKKNAPVIALIGRIVKIKDIKTFIRSIAIVHQALPEASAWIVGPSENEKSYAQECKDLAGMLHLDKYIAFTGIKKIEEILPKIDLLVLSSISEGQPLVALEALAAGIPVVLTDVGCAADLVYGHNAEDKALGTAGKIVSISNPSQLAEAIVYLLSHPESYQAAAETGKHRIQTYYDIHQVTTAYKKLYQERLWPA